MQSQSLSKPFERSRLGIHYYPDSLHYREEDLHAWLPELQGLGITWLVLQAPAERAIPEYFLKGCLNAGIQPILHFDLPVDWPGMFASLPILFQTYARWGIQYAVLFNRPNSRGAWKPSTWAQADLVERFLDIFLPHAESALTAGLTPVFPPLEPGGDYWDLAFLRAALRGIGRRGNNRLLQNMLLSACAKTNGHPLDWGAGGPETWPGARPYFTPPGVQDQTGFHIFDWYSTVAQAELGSPRGMILLEAGSRYGEAAPPDNPELLSVMHAQRNLALIHALTGRNDTLEPVTQEVLACNFWLLSSSPESPHALDAWYQADGSNLPVVGALRQWIATNRFSAGLAHPKTRNSSPLTHPSSSQDESIGSIGSTEHPIQHYLLLPNHDPGGADWRLDSLRPLLKNSRPTVGFSLEEAALAAHVTVVGGVLAYSDNTLEELRSRGCTVERFIDDGTTLAT